MALCKATSAGPQFTEFSSTAVARHREHFGRGPGAAKTHVSDNLVGVYELRMEEVLGRRVEAHMSSIHVDPDVAVEIFVLSEEDSMAPLDDFPA